MNFIVQYKNICNDFITVNISCESCHISNHDDGRSCLVFMIGSDIVNSFWLSSVVFCILDCGIYPNDGLITGRDE